jgi:probable phosphoglycerate mutase
VRADEVRGHEVVLVRHGETEWSRSGRHTSRTDLDLTDSGRAAAASLAPMLAGRRFARVLVSPMRRSVVTAQLAGFDDVEELADLCEWDYGEYEGRTRDEIRDKVPDWTVWTHESPGGESAPEVAARVDRVISHVRAIDGDILVFGHGHALRVMAARWCDWPPEKGARLALDPASVCVLGYDRDLPVVRQWNWSATIR